eukprot:scaffold442430_cov18-Prasinocladus_malaysianus.AAC.1
MLLDGRYPFLSLPPGLHQRHTQGRSRKLKSDTARRHAAVAHGSVNGGEWSGLTTEKVSHLVIGLFVMTLLGQFDRLAWPD